MIVSLDHIQLAMPAGTEDEMRAFYCGVLGMVEKEKPAPLKGRGGFWAQAGALERHFGVDPDFQPAKKAHPAFVVGDIDALAKTLDTVGCVAHWDTALPEVTRFFIFDPVGNRVELIAQAAERA